jgi:uncharacterized membrane protein YphA (DoxX/SURF4 family)
VRWFGTLLRLVVGCVWIVAGVIKLPHPQSSVTAVRAYQLLPTGWTDLVGHLLPLFEVLIGVLLVLGLFTRVAAVASTLLQLAFVIGIASVWSRHIAINCGCFGDGGVTSWATAKSKYPWELARDCALFLASAFLVVRSRTRVAIDNWLLPERQPAEELEGSDVEIQP